MKIQTFKLRKIVSLLLGGEMSLRGIAAITDVSHQSVMRIRDKIQDVNLTVETLKTLDDIELQQKFIKKRAKSKDLDAQLDWSLIDKEHKQKKIPLIVLWTELTQSLSSEGEHYISEHQFRRRYKQWLRSQHISMRQLHLPGEKVYIDFCGKTIPIYDSAQQPTTYAQIFVAVLGGSGLIFAYAVESQKSIDWLKCHIKMFEFFGGVPKFLVPDNLKSAITKHTSQEIITNRAYQELADHYSTLITPARVRKPKDKSLSEIGVRIIQGWALSSFRNMKFFSVNELNEALSVKLNQINSKVTKTYTESRQQRFISIERDTLQQLPCNEFCLGEWSYNQRVGSDYHVQYLGKAFSVPYNYANQLVDLKVSEDAMEIYNGAKRIAVHLVASSVSGTNPNHMPEQHRHYHESNTTDVLDWAKNIGDSTLQWCQHQLEQGKNFANGRKACEKLRRLYRIEQDASKIEASCAFAIQLKNFSFSYLKEVVSKNLNLRKAPEKTAWIKSHENIRGAANYADIGTDL